MFVRFRKLPCDGFRPFGVADTRIACRRPWRGTACRGHCHAKPRCRWRIGRDEQLVPYRLKVMLVENRRVNGKVKQEIIAVLGSIEATLLPEFWDGIDKDAADKLKGEKWELQSLRGRVAFWKGANRRLKRLVNRLGPDTKRIRMAAHKRVPFPMEAGLKRLELLEAMADFDDAQDGIKHGEHMVASGQKAIKAGQKSLEASEKLLRWERLSGVQAANKLAKLSTK